MLLAETDCTISIRYSGKLELQVCFSSPNPQQRPWLAVNLSTNGRFLGFWNCTLQGKQLVSVFIYMDDEQITVHLEHLLAADSLGPAKTNPEPALLVAIQEMIFRFAS